MHLKKMVKSLFLVVVFSVMAQTVFGQDDKSAWLRGTWEGQVTTAAGATMPLVLDATARSYRATYSANGCVGSWSVYDIGAKKATFVESFSSYGRNPSCRNGNKITIEKVNDDELRIKSDLYNSRDTFFRGVLRRKPQAAIDTERAAGQQKNAPKKDDFVQVLDPVHSAGRKLIETGLYAAYHHHPYYSNLRRAVNGFCDYNIFYNGSVSTIALVFKVDEQTVITDDAAYRERFEKEILPTIKAGCADVKEVVIKNYVHGYRINHAAEFWRYGDSIPEGLEEFPLNRVEVRIEPNGSLSYKGYRDGDQSSRTYASISRLKDAKKKYDAERIAFENQQAVKKQQQAQQRRDDDSAKAAPVLAYYPKNAPEKYDFSGYQAGGHFQKIFEGEFDSFTGGHATRQAWVDSTLKKGFGSPDLRDPIGILAKLLSTTADAADIRSRRDMLDLIYYAYHLEYRKQCGVNREMSWGTSDLIEFFVTKGGVKIENSSALGEIYAVRVPYLPAFNSAYINLGNSSNVRPYVPESLSADIKKLLTAEKCSSPALRRFETQLYLATEWMLPVSELAMPVAPPPPPVKQPQLPAAKKNTPKPAGKEKP